MALIELNVSLAAEQHGCRPEVRVFVDLMPDNGLASEREVPLVPRDGQWHGAFAVSDDLPQAFLFRFGLVAHTGAAWSYRITHRGLGRELAADADLLPQSKCWIVGSCELPQLRQARLR